MSQHKKFKLKILVKLG